MNKKVDTKRTEKKSNQLLKNFAFLFMFLLFGYLMLLNGPGDFSLNSITGYVSFEGSAAAPKIDNELSSEKLTCSWHASDDTTNVTAAWYNGSSSTPTINASGPSLFELILTENYTKKGETWKCNVTLINDTGSINDIVEVEILSTAPSFPKLYYQDIDQDLSMTINEDQTYTIYFNATDYDNDPLLYELGSTDFCAVINETTGETSCTASHSDLDLNSNEELETVINVTLKAIEDVSPGYSNHVDAQFTIVPVDDAPEISSMSNQSTYDNESWTFGVTVDDEENDELTYELSSPEFDKIDFNETTKEFYFNTTDGTSGISTAGNYSITLTVYQTDDASLNDSEVLNLEILETNIPPVFDTVNFESDKSQGESFVVYLNVSDVNNDTLDFSVDHPDLYNVTNIVSDNLGNYTAEIELLPSGIITNDHVIYRNFNVTVTDGQSNGIIDYEINTAFINTNDAPEIFRNSAYSINEIPAGTSNDIMNLSGYTNLYYQYKVNATDKDLNTYEGEQLTYELNDSNFNISNDGIFSFNINNLSLVKNHSILLTLTDDSGAFTTQVINLEIKENTLPYFEPDLTNKQCFELVNCVYDINATDNETGTDNLTYDLTSLDIISSESDEFNLTLNSTTGLINFTPIQNDVGEYNLTVSIEDKMGSSFSDSFILSINNTNNNPNLTINSVPYNIVYNKTFYFDLIETDDLDLNLTNSNENLSISYNFSPELKEDLVQVTKLSNYLSRVRIDTYGVSNPEQINLSVNVTDNAGAWNSSYILFDILSRGSAPEIINITPYPDIEFNNTPIYDWYSVPVSSGGSLNLSINETDTVLFNYSAIDDDAYDYISSNDNNLSTHWYFDGELINDSNILLEDNHTLNYSFDYFSSGNHILFLQVNDTRFNQANWTWNLTVNNVNRVPTFEGPLRNFTGDFSIVGVDSSQNDYFVNGVNDSRGFYDPDFDLNFDNMHDLDESSNLTYYFLTTDCEDVVDITMQGDGIELVGENVGMCSGMFRATDAHGGSVLSNEVYINVTEVEVIRDEGGGGGSSTRTTPIPIPITDDSINPLDIIHPESVVIYKNSTLKIPITLKNNWTNEINGIQLSLDDTQENTSFKFSQDFFDVIEKGENVSLNLTVYNYREPGSYEITLYANVSDPDFVDTATILVNSLEEKDEGETLETKLAFAKDLLSRHQECRELDEVLNLAEQNLKSGNQESANIYLENAINGCKYLATVNEVNTAERSPGDLNILIKHNFIKDLLKNKSIIFIASAVLLLILIGLIVLKKKILKKVQHEEYNEDEIRIKNQEKEAKLRKISK
jgi:hypothetical protein